MKINLRSVHTLQVLFPFVATWAAVNLLASEIDSLQGLNPFSERSPLHNPAEGMLAWVPVMLVLAVGIRIVRQWPGVLRLPPATPLASTALRFAMHSLTWVAVIFCATIAAGYLLYDPSGDAPQQRYLGVWLAGFMIAPALAPLAALFTVWRFFHRKAGRSA